MKTIQQVLQKYSPSLMEKEGVAGVCIGMTKDSLPCIKVMLEKNDPAVRKDIPLSLEGFCVEIEETGPVRPMGRP